MGNFEISKQIQLKLQAMDNIRKSIESLNNNHYIKHYFELQKALQVQQIELQELKQALLNNIQKDCKEHIYVVTDENDLYGTYNLTCVKCMEKLENVPKTDEDKNYIFPSNIDVDDELILKIHYDYLRYDHLEHDVIIAILQEKYQKSDLEL